MSAVYARQELCYNPDIEHTKPLSEAWSSNAAAGRFPAPAHQRQDVDFRRAFDVLRHAITDHAFPAASVAITRQGKMIALKALGRFTYGADSPEATTASIFDLASISKVVATTTMAMILYERGLLDLEMPVAAVTPQFSGQDSRRGDVTLHMLLAHSSGLPAYEKLFLRAKTPEELLAAAFNTPLVAEPGTRAEYSDVGFIILGVALERIADEALDTFCQREVFGPLGMTRTAFNPAPAWRLSIPATVEDRGFRQRVIQGEVQDENASVLGGVAGHAGLFATAEDVAIFAHAMLEGGRPILRPETLALFTRREPGPEGTSRALGWDTPSSPSQSGHHFPPSSFGHLGYTGTSLWIDPERQLSVTLLTNRTWPDCGQQAIKEVRPQFHDAVIEALEVNG
ncbi:MAG: beta-lactamase family protein [Acidobacteriia bacterium]|nr:beta-lactamase family protein [Terriglobia bacterium]